MTDDRQPRKRRRRRRRGGGPTNMNGDGTVNGNVAPQNGNALQNDRFGGGAGRRRRQRHRKGRGSGGGGGGYAPEPSRGPPPIDLPPGELAPVKGVLYIKPSGSGILVDVANNFVPQQGDPLVPRSIIERLHLDAGLEIGGRARRTRNGLEFVGLEAVEGMSLEEFRESRRPFSELISIDPNQCFKLETESERLTTRVLDLLAP